MPDTGRRWSWPQFAIALGLIPLGFLVWIVGMEKGVVPSSSDQFPFWLGNLFLVAAPFIGLAGGVWLLVLLVRRFWPKKAITE
jgi:hypothetical protein